MKTAHFIGIEFDFFFFFCKQNKNKKQNKTKTKTKTKTKKQKQNKTKKKIRHFKFYPRAYHIYFASPFQLSPCGRGVSSLFPNRLFLLFPEFHGSSPYLACSDAWKLFLLKMHGCISIHQISSSPSISSHPLTLKWPRGVPWGPTTVFRIIILLLSRQNFWPDLYLSPSWIPSVWKKKNQVVFSLMSKN